VLEVTAPWGGTTRHLKVWKESGRGGITWDALQTIKDDLLGPEVQAIEVYPPQNWVVNDATMRHLWEVPRTVVDLCFMCPWRR
jgi:hypothetical protein